jgi:hypothetical protein
MLFASVGAVVRARTAVGGSALGRTCRVLPAVAGAADRLLQPVAQSRYLVPQRRLGLHELFGPLTRVGNRGMVAAPEVTANFLQAATGEVARQVHGNASGGHYRASSGGAL